MYRTFCDVSSHFIINAFLEKKKRKERRAQEPSSKLIQLSSTNQIQVNITKNFKKSSFGGFSEQQDSKSFLNPTASELDRNYLMICKKNKKLSFRKSIQNCESSNLLSVVRADDENMEKLTRRSKTENGTKQFFPDTIEDLEIPGANTHCSDKNSINVFRSQNSLAQTCSRHFSSKSCYRSESKKQKLHRIRN